MRSQLVVLAATVALLTPTWAASQPTAQPAKTVSDTYTVTTDQEKPGAKPGPAMAIEPPAGRWVKTLTNVQVEISITDQSGASTPEKKTVSMVVSSGSWGRIRSNGSVPRPDGGSMSVDLNVDARPFVAIDGPVQLELTMNYSPSGDGKTRPPTVNQSLTVILQSGKPLLISQAADPVGDRKIIVEAKATVLK